MLRGWSHNGSVVSGEPSGNISSTQLNAEIVLIHQRLNKKVDAFPLADTSNQEESTALAGG